VRTSRTSLLSHPLSSVPPYKHLLDPATLKQELGKREDQFLSDGNLFVRYDLNSTTWHPIGGPDILVRKFQASTICSEEIYVFGGMKNRDCVNDLHFYDLETEQWSPIHCV
jgi:Kelch motif